MEAATILEDELGDILEKGLKHAAFSEEALAQKTGIDINRIKDALDYRYELTWDELKRLSKVLGLNEVGLSAVAEDRYPLPSPCGLPFCVFVLPIPFGVGVVNAYLVGACGSHEAMLFDSGISWRELKKVWPERITRVPLHFVTHWHSDHAGGTSTIVRQHNLPYVLSPKATGSGNRRLMEGDKIEFGDFLVETYSTPGHVAEHNSYLVSVPSKPSAKKLLIAGDLFFAGSVAGGFYDREMLLHHVKRMWHDLPPETVVAPGHGPLTTIETEREFNPFSS